MSYSWGTPTTDGGSDVKVIDRRAKVRRTVVPSLARSMLWPAVAAVAAGLLTAAFATPVASGVAVIELPADPEKVPVHGMLMDGVGWVTMGEPLGEVWWTTRDCPPGVQVPCLDPDVSLFSVPRWAGGWAPNQF